MTRRTIFLFGLGVGAWLNIWTPFMGPWVGFVFAYALCFWALWSAAMEGITHDHPSQ